mmetsp:Transcript_34901/g.53562  ORF Transcript_34901/g.53562 Transcript_34901/m.53562 type:complete len:118 (+) Transcript_34901:95-448(+)
MPEKTVIRSPKDPLFKPSPKWNYQNLGDGNLFSKSEKQENVVYDLDYLKYMRTQHRGIPLPPCLMKGSRRNDSVMHTTMVRGTNNNFSSMQDEMEKLRIERNKSIQPQTTRHQETSS